MKESIQHQHPGNDQKVQQKEAETNPIGQNISAIIRDVSDAEERFKRWKKAYQQHLELMEQFYRWQEVYKFKLAQYEEKRQMFRDMREDLV